MMGKGILMLKIGMMNSYSLARKDGKKGLRLGIAALLGFVFLYVEVILCVGFYFAAKALNDTGQADALLALVGVGLAAFVFLMAATRASSYLYAFKDFDLLMSLPAPVSAVLFSKIAQFYVSNLLVCAMLYIPAVVMYGVVTAAAWWVYLLAVPLFFLAPLIPMAVGAALSFPIAYGASRARKTNLLMIVGTLLLVVAIFVVQRGITGLVSSGDMAALTGLTESLASWYRPAAWLARGLSGDWLGTALFTLTNLIFLMAFLLVFARVFRRVNGLMTERVSGAAYKAKPMKVSSRLRALYAREIAQYFGSYIYVTNTCIMAVLFTVLTIAMMFVNPETALSAAGMAELLGEGGLSATLYPSMVCLAVVCAGMVSTTSASVSIEGKSLWILKSSPIPFTDIAMAKVLLNLTVTLPLFALDALLLSLRFGFSALETALFILTVAAVCLLAALVGLICNLRFPKLEWKTQTHAVKQSFSVIAAMLVNLIAITVGIVAYFTLFGMGDLRVYLLLADVVTLAASAGLWAYLRDGGRKMFEGL